MINLGLSTLPIGNPPPVMPGKNYSDFLEYTRVAVITYDEKATILANYSMINSAKDLTNVLNGVQVSTSQTANMYKYKVLHFHKTFLKTLKIKTAF